MKKLVEKLTLKMLNKKAPPNCIICTLSFAQLFGNYIGICPMQGFCDHTKKKMSPHYVVSTLKLIIGTIFSMVFVTILIGYLYLILQKGNKEIPKLQMIAETIFCFQSTTLLLGYITKIKTHLLVVNGWVNLNENGKFFGINTLLTETNSNLIQKRSCLTAFIIITATISFGVILYSLEIDEKNFDITLFRRISVFLGTYVQLIVVFRISIYHYLLKNILKRYKDIILSHINIRIPTLINNVQIDYNELVNSKNFKTQLTLFSRFYSAISLNMKHYNRLVNPMALIWFLCVLGVLIINIYLIVKEFNVDSIGNDSVLVELSTLFVSIGLLYIVKSVNSVIYVSDEISSILYRLPTRKLKQDEIEHLVNLINNLSLQKPTLNACDVFLVTTQLLASGLL
ncbi:uncharacterized protein [Onthophagus taurus]|uniref:uncharacterized protein isoform X2 n=1 Tax=Onthophagus taurus TaxID=166361 RepID=UPI000C20AECF|nr:uncharacterized protein LOC111428626 isoform X2 [Onthophagus taurus]